MKAWRPAARPPAGRTSFFPTNYNTRGQFLPRVKSVLILIAQCAHVYQKVISWKQLWNLKYGLSTKGGLWREKLKPREYSKIYIFTLVKSASKWRLMSSGYPSKKCQELPPHTRVPFWNAFYQYCKYYEVSYKFAFRLPLHIKEVEVYKQASKCSCERKKKRENIYCMTAYPQHFANCISGLVWLMEFVTSSSFFVILNSKGLGL